VVNREVYEVTDVTGDDEEETAAALTLTVEEDFDFLVVEVVVDLAFLEVDEEATLTKVEDEDALSWEALAAEDALAVAAPEAAWEADAPLPSNLLTGVAPGKYVVPIVGIGMLEDMGKPDARSFGMVAAE
jgi:hypothetical protein